MHCGAAPGVPESGDAARGLGQARARSALHRHGLELAHLLRDRHLDRQPLRRRRAVKAVNVGRARQHIRRVLVRAGRAAERGSGF
eukprot:4256973-Prymnesium_polylepis.1